MNLGDLEDVDTTGAVDLDRLVLDGGSGLWKPKPLLEWCEFTVAYPEGDNGWVAFEEFDPVVAVDHVENTTSTPSGNNARVWEFTVTEAMAATLTVLEGPYDGAVGMRISASLETAGFSTTRTTRTSVTVNGEQRSFQSQGVLTSRRRVAVAHTVQCQVGDVVALHVWLTTADATPLNLVLAAAAPVFMGFPDGVDDIAMCVDGSPSLPADYVDTPPAGVTAGMTGSTASSLRLSWVRSNGASSTSPSTTSLRAWALDPGSVVPPALWPLSYASSLLETTIAVTSTGDPYLFTTYQLPSYGLWVAVLPTPE